MDELHEARLEVIEEELCQVMYDRYPVTRMHVCAWDVNRQRVSPCEVRTYKQMEGQSMKVIGGTCKFASSEERGQRVQSFIILCLVSSLRNSLSYS